MSLKTLLGSVDVERMNSALGPVIDHIEKNMAAMPEGPDSEWFGQLKKLFGGGKATTPPPPKTKVE